MNRILTSLAVFATLLPAAAQADQVIGDDLIVQGSICTGPDCANNMAFGFSTVVISGTDPSLLFQDTSTNTFPSTDWRVGTQSADDTFYIENADTGTNVLTISGNGNAVALGGNSTIIDGAVTVGGLKVSNVADGTADTDAVTLGQLNAAVAALPPVDLSGVQADLTALSNEIDAVGAIGSAMSALQVNPRATGNHFVSFGLGYYDGTTAMAIGSFHFLANDRIFVNTGVSKAINGNGGTAARLGFTFGN